MDNREALIYDEFERNYWWFKGRREIIFGFLKKRNNTRNLSILDIGCGTGANLIELEELGGQVIGLDLSLCNLKLCKEKNLHSLCRGNASELPFIQNSFNIVTALDIIEHLEDDSAALGEICRVMAKGGILIATVPAYQFLFSPYADCGHKRRYMLKGLRKLVEAAGLRIERISYFNTFLFPVMVAERVYEKFLVKEGDPYDVSFKKLPKVLNDIFTGVLNIEAWTIGHGLNMPFGGSVICLAIKD